MRRRDDAHYSRLLSYLFGLLRRNCILVLAAAVFVPVGACPCATVCVCARACSCALPTVTGLSDQCIVFVSMSM